MSKKSLHVFANGAAIAFLIFLFCYFRVKPIYFQTVGYTFDQGRDFLKAAEIGLYHNLTFIGPTTGIGGVFHGAWWYYLLTIAFLVNGGSPEGFYYLNVCIQFLWFVFLILFLKKYTDLLTTFLVSLIVAVSGFYIFTSIFIANNVMAIPSFTILILVSLLMLRRKTSLTLFQNKKATISLSLPLIAGLALGSVAEFEFAFGLMLIPVYLIVMGIFQWRYNVFQNKKNLGLFIVGLIFPFTPRILFELKNGFMQTKVLFNFVFHPSYHTPKSFFEVYRDRKELFMGYYDGIFFSQLIKYALSIYVVLCAGILIAKRQIEHKKELIFLIFTLILLFGFSTLYKDTFWSYYYDGIQILPLLIGAYILSQFHRKVKPGMYVTSLFLICCTILVLKMVVNDMKKPPVYDGIRVQEDIVTYIQQQEKENDYCVQIYTPPVIPYTYQYLFLYKQIANGRREPNDTWTHKRCWFIVEYDDNKERKAAWITDHIPEKATIISERRIKDVAVQLWKR